MYKWCWNRLLIDLCEGHPIWIGLSGVGQEDNWHWNDGSDFSYSAWGNGAPSNGNETTCAVMNLSEENQAWVDVDCQEEIRVACKSNVQPLYKWISKGNTHLFVKIEIGLFDNDCITFSLVNSVFTFSLWCVHQNIAKLLLHLLKVDGGFSPGFQLYF